MDEDDPRALFQQLIPQSFLKLQEGIEKSVVSLNAEGKPPIMEDADFRSTFRDCFEDEDELAEAVYFLNSQGS